MPYLGRGERSLARPAYEVAIVGHCRPSRGLEEWSADAIPDNSIIFAATMLLYSRCALSLLRSGRGVHLVGLTSGPQLVKALKKLGGPTTHCDLNMPQRQVYDAIDLWENKS